MCECGYMLRWEKGFTIFVKQGYLRLFVVRPSSKRAYPSRSLYKIRIFLDFFLQKKMLHSSLKIYHVFMYKYFFPFVVSCVLVMKPTETGKVLLGKQEKTEKREKWRTTKSSRQANSEVKQALFPNYYQEHFPTPTGNIVWKSAGFH